MMEGVRGGRRGRGEVEGYKEREGEEGGRGKDERERRGDKK